MTLALHNADDSCLINQTVPAVGVASSPSVHDEKSQLPNPHPAGANPPHPEPGAPVSCPSAEEDEKHGDHVADKSTAAAEAAPTSSRESVVAGDSVHARADADADANAGGGGGGDNEYDDDDDDDDFPEGGLRAWLVVLGSFCAMLSVYGLINSAAVFESYFSTHQLAGYNPSAIGWIFSVYLFVVFFAGVQVGPIFDRHGPRVLVTVGGVLVVASQLLLGLCKEYYQILLTYSILGGLGGALLNVPAYGVIAHFFRVRRGLATGIASTAGSIGGIVLPVYLQWALPRLGFGWSTRAVGFVLLLLSAIATLLVRARLPPSPRPVTVLPDWSLFRDLKFLLCCVGVWFMEWGIFTPLTYIVSYAVAHGQGGEGASAATDAYTLLALLNAGSFFGRFLPGFLADRLGRFNVITLTNGLCVAAILCLWLPAGDSRAMLIAFAVAFGFASGSNLGLYPVCVGQLCDSRDYGRFYSTTLMVGSFGTLTSLPIAGALLGIGGGAASDQGWLALILFAALSYAIAMSCFLGVRVLAVSWRVKEVY
ncbi:MFS general substrate transporter [Durotheca rogersii]|uniref:MFS general substrate transporter n=1 Tax=Durotheca rogersii TaxID=419775 RepID=UPI00221F8658|nr:MFS general substrate transporter [Durotheca rogersii]KAI5867021.1 MFS general substrate transporter [Durotheca rogersii]